jgi:nitrogen fixation protein FixH
MATGLSASRQAVRGTVKGWHVLASVLGFFAVVFAVNGYFLFAALSTYSGVVSVEPYVKGLHYNQRIAAQERQDELKWIAKLGTPAAGAPLTLQISDRDGAGIDGLSIAAQLGRPATQSFDRDLTFVPRGNGLYEAMIGRIEQGGWLLAIQASRRRVTGELDTFRMRRRLWLKQ